MEVELKRRARPGAARMLIFASELMLPLGITAPREGPLLLVPIEIPVSFE